MPWPNVITKKALYVCMAADELPPDISVAGTHMRLSLLCNATGSVCFMISRLLQFSLLSAPPFISALP